MLLLVKYFTKILDSYRRHGLKGVYFNLRNTCINRFYLPVLFCRFRGKIINIPSTAKAGHIIILKLLITQKFFPKLLDIFLKKLRWFVIIELKKHGTENSWWYYRQELEPGSSKLFPTLLDIPLQLPGEECDVEICISLEPDGNCIRAFKWLLARFNLPITGHKLESSQVFFPLSSETYRFLTVRMDITEGCNLGCRMCNIRLKNVRNKEISPGLFEKICMEVFPYARKVYLSCGREPLLTDNLDYYLSKTIESGVPSIELVTNAMLLSEKKIRSLVEHGVYRLTISLDSPDAGILPDIRPGADISVIKENIKRLQEVKKQNSSLYPILRFNLVLQRKNYRDLVKYLDLGEQLGVREFRFQHLIVFSQGMEEDSLFSLKHETNAVLEEAVNHANNRGLILELPVLFSSDSKHDNKSRFISGRQNVVSCKAPWTSIIFEPDGSVIPCCSLDMFTMGNIRDDSFLDIWNSKPYRNLRNQFIQSNNETCYQHCLAIELGNPNHPKSIFRNKLHVSK